jgi:exodeoxyribonuclease III
MPLHLVTWNVNSVRARLDNVLTFLDEHEPDVLCLQETKVEDRLFPRVPFMDYGYTVTLHGTKGYAGVATISKSAPSEVHCGFRSAPEDRAPRILNTVIDGVRIYNLYVPNGTALDSDAFPYKLEWFQRLEAEIKETCGAAQEVIVTGDFNIAPDTRDVWDLEAMKDSLHFTAEEHEALAGLLSCGLRDCFRKHSEEAGQFTWFDYRNAAFQRGHGLRIDHVYATAGLYERSSRVLHDAEPRSWESPSDHLPVHAWFD